MRSRCDQQAGLAGIDRGAVGMYEPQFSRVARRCSELVPGAGCDGAVGATRHGRGHASGSWVGRRWCDWWHCGCQRGWAQGKRHRRCAGRGGRSGSGKRPRTHRDKGECAGDCVAFANRDRRAIVRATGAEVLARVTLWCWSRPAPQRACARRQARSKILGSDSNYCAAHRRGAFAWPASHVSLFPGIRTTSSSAATTANAFSRRQPIGR